MTTITYPAQPYHRLKRQQLITLAIALEEQRDRAYASRDQAVALLRDLVDQDDCWFDHHGGCQAHGYLSLEPGEKCPHAEAKELLAALDQPAVPTGEDGT